MPRARGGGMDGEKKSLIATERDEAARAAWREETAALPAAGFVFVDESGTHTRMTPLYAYAPRGERAYGHAPRNHTRNTTLVAALTLDGVCDSMTVEGAMDREAFVAGCPLGSMEQGLGPKLVAGHVVVMDNLSMHKGERVRAVIEGCGCRLLFLPPYSPDMTPIEGMFSKVKQALRRAGKRTQAELEAAIGAALDTVTAADAAGWFAAAGYPPATGQPL